MIKKLFFISLILSVTALAVLTYRYSFKVAAISVIFGFFGIIFTSLPLFRIGGLIKRDIYTMKHGEKIHGQCIGYERGSEMRFGTLKVEWKDIQYNKKIHHYIALHHKFTYPYDVTVYKYNSYSNLGRLTLAMEALYFLIFFTIWALCSIGSIYKIIEIIKYL